MAELTWKELAIALAKMNTHEVWCPFEGCICDSVKQREELIAEVYRRMNREEQEARRDLHEKR